MSVTLYIGHSGQRFVLDPSVTSLESLRSWIGQNAGIQPRSQVLLTAQGKQVRSQTLLTENELFVFDSKLFASKDPVSLPGLEDVAAYEPGKAPDTLKDQNDLQAWQNLFRLRKSWASALLTACGKLARQAEEYQHEEAVIARSLGVAVASLQQHVKNGEKKFSSVATWADDALREQEERVLGWEQNLDSLRSIPARADFSRFLQTPHASSRRASQQNNITTLQGFVDVAKTRKAAGSAKQLSDDLNDGLKSLEDKLSHAGTQTDELLQAVDQLSNASRSYTESESEASQLLTEIEVTTQKIASDFEHVQSLTRVTQSTSQASKMALLHTRNYLPNLSEYCIEMNELVTRHRDRRQRVAETALEHMQTLSSIESQLASLYAGIESFGLPEEEQQSFAMLGHIARLPSVYGQLLVECVRRREWVAKMKRDSSTLQEEMATYQEEEERRRKKWMRSVEDVVNTETIQSSRALGIELSLQNEGGSWPMVTRQELQDYLDLLLQVYGDGPVTEELDQAIKELDKPTKKQIKHAKAFKNGSMHEAAFGETSLMLRGDEQYKSLRDVNGRLEEELKGQKSRVRKLEDLLHRSTQFSRTGSADMFAPQSATDRAMTPPGVPTPLPSGELSRNSSLKHRRLSTTQGIEEKKLARRVVDLEAELHAHREEAKSRHNSDAEAQKQVEEAIMTKKDLMENMEAQQREFASERRSLEAELKEAKEKVDEVEGEIERLLESRDDERTGIDTRVAALEQEIAQLKEDAAGHAARAATEFDARVSLEQKHDSVEKARASLDEQLQTMRKEQREADTEQFQRLAIVHSQLSPDEDAPTDLAGLAAAVEELSRRSAAHAKDLGEAVAFAKSENESLRASHENQKASLSAAESKQVETEEQMRQLQERLSTEEAKATSLDRLLKDEQDQLATLRGKFAEGETGSEALRQRVADEEAKVAELSSELAEAHSHANNLDVELTRLQEKHKASQASAEASNERLGKRAEKAKDVSQRLYAQNTRMTRLLERLGLVVTYPDDNMVVERASKMGASTSMTDPHSQMSRMITSPPPTRKSSTAEDSMDLSSILWPEAQSLEDEATQYAAFMEQIGRFNIDTFAEAVVKRVRDFEYTARKYQREARESVKRADAYKDRAQRLKSEAHAKIAVKDFKEGDLALFLPTRGQSKGAWAAFNIGCPHYFLAEREGMRLGTRDFIVARIAKVEQKIVDLSKTLPQKVSDDRSIDEASEAPSFDDDNPFELSDGLTWWMVHAAEERGAGGAPTTPGLGKSTVAAANVDAKGSIRIKRGNKGDDASKQLNLSLDSRRSSSTSKKGVLANFAGSPTIGTNMDGAAARPRSESQTSVRPPPGPSALGIAASPPPNSPPSMTAQPGSPIARKPSSLSQQQVSPPKARQRSKSPSKSVRSLQKHLEPQSPAKASPSKQAQGGKNGWESLWSAEFSLESPSKKGES